MGNVQLEGMQSPQTIIPNNHSNVCSIQHSMLQRKGLLAEQGDLCIGFGQVGGQVGEHLGGQAV